MSQSASLGKLEPETVKNFTRALKPFFLRRTKEAVLKDLPEKTEQVLHCELNPAERRRYTELRDYYRMRLKKEVARVGVGRAKIIVLEALLRLRQAACHPGLLDKKYLHMESAKIQSFLEQLLAIVSEGHKVLVFSQFTSLLNILEPLLQRNGILFLRLDGQSSLNERKESVKSFQDDPHPKVFLISLKAGGVGLNLTAAQYIFILDPWWNPAVESQAIDRAHRIGQKNKVIAYRLISKDTVEEKIMELQKSKRELVSLIVTSETSLLKQLSRDDIEFLLS